MSQKPIKTVEKLTSEVNFAELWQELNHNQQRFAVAMLDAPTKKEAALSIGIEPRTTYTWPANVDAVIEVMRAQACESALGILEGQAVKAAMVKVGGLDSDDEKMRQDQATEVLDRVLGKPTQRQKLEGTGEGGEIEIKQVGLSDAEREAALEGLLESRRLREESD